MLTKLVLILHFLQKTIKKNFGELKELLKKNQNLTSVYPYIYI